MLKDDNLSHNIYNENAKLGLTVGIKYLILVENIRPDFETEQNYIFPCNNLTDAIEFASNQKKICQLYERRGSMAKTWTYLCDISAGVI